MCNPSRTQVSLAASWKTKQRLWNGLYDLRLLNVIMFFRLDCRRFYKWKDWLWWIETKSTSISGELLSLRT